MLLPERPLPAAESNPAWAAQFQLLLPATQLAEETSKHDQSQLQRDAAKVPATLNPTLQVLLTDEGFAARRGLWWPRWGLSPLGHGYNQTRTKRSAFDGASPIVKSIHEKIISGHDLRSTGTRGLSFSSFNPDYSSAAER